jgi:hypothetical protein
MTKTLALSLSLFALTQLNAAQPGPLAYAFGFEDLVNGPTRFGVLDIGTGAFYRITDISNLAQGIGRDAHGQIYIVDEKADLLHINQGNVKTEVIGNTGVTTPSPVGHSVEVFASLTDGELFLMDFSNNLYSVNAGTGAATLIGSTGIQPITHRRFAVSFAGDCSSLFFTLAERDENFNVIQPSTLYRIDPRTAAATVVGPAPRGVTGSAFIDDTLYAFTLDLRFFGGGTEGPHIYSIDTTTGAASPVADLNFPSIWGAVRFTGAQAGRCNAQ